MAYGMNTWQGGVGQGVEKAAGNILNAFFMKKKLDTTKEVAAAQKERASAETRKADAYTNYLNNQDILKQAMAAHDEVPAWLETMQAQKAARRGPGSTANQLATRYAEMPGAAPPAIASPQSPDGPGLPRGMAQAQERPAAARPSPVVPSPAMPPIPHAADPRTLLQPDPNRPMYADDEA